METYTITERFYRHDECITFRKTREDFGGFSNFATTYPVIVNKIFVRCTEILYQACRFPHLPEIQRQLIAISSPLSAKLKSRAHISDTRSDWEAIKIDVMRWCLRVKLAQNWERFSTLLDATGNVPIVEVSKRDDFWGARPYSRTTYRGKNVLGRLLMELRMDMLTYSRSEMLYVPPLKIPNFKLNGRPIRAVTAHRLTPR